MTHTQRTEADERKRQIAFWHTLSPALHENRQRKALLSVELRQNQEVVQKLLERQRDIRRQQEECHATEVAELARFITS